MFQAAPGPEPLARPDDLDRRRLIGRQRRVLLVGRPVGDDDDRACRRARAARRPASARSRSAGQSVATRTTVATPGRRLVEARRHRVAGPVADGPAAPRPSADGRARGRSPSRDRRSSSRPPRSRPGSGRPRPSPARRARPPDRGRATGRRRGSGFGRHVGRIARRRSGQAVGDDRRRSLRSCTSARPVRRLVVDVADELRQPRVAEHLADREDLAGVEPVVVRHALDRRPDRPLRARARQSIGAGPPPSARPATGRRAAVTAPTRRASPRATAWSAGRRSRRSR